MCIRDRFKRRYRNSYRKLSFEKQCWNTAWELWRRRCAAITVGTFRGLQESHLESGKSMPSWRIFSLHEFRSGYAIFVWIVFFCRKHPHWSCSRFTWQHTALGQEFIRRQPDYDKRNEKTFLQTRWHYLLGTEVFQPRHKPFNRALIQRQRAARNTGYTDHLRQEL